MNQAASCLANRKELHQATEKERFLKAERKHKKRKLLAKKALFWQSYPPKGNERGVSMDYLLLLTRKFRVGWLKVTFLGETRAAVRLNIKSSWGLTQVTPFWACCILFNNCNRTSLEIYKIWLEKTIYRELNFKSLDSVCSWDESSINLQSHLKFLCIFMIS